MIKFYLRFIIGLYLFGICIQVDGQQADMNQLLSAALNHSSVKILDRSGEDLFLLKFKVPFIEKIEFRTETDRLLTSRQEFLARTSFNGFQRKKAENDKFLKLVSWKANKMIEVRHEMLTDRYFDIIDALHQAEKIDITQDLLDNYYRKEKISEDLMVNGLSADLAEYIKIKESILLEKAKIKDSKDELQTIWQKFGIDSTVSFKLTDIIGIDQAALMIRKIVPDFEKHIYLNEFNAEHDYLHSVLHAEKAEAAKIIDFAQVRYTVRDDLLLQNRFSIGVGFLIPWKGSSGLKQNEIRIKQNILLAEKEVKKLKLQSDFENIKNKFEQKYAQYQMLKDIINDPVIKKLKDQVIASGRLDLLKVVKMEESTIEMGYKMIALKYELLELYIRVLSNAGNLYTTPYKNFLHPLIPYIMD